MKLKTRFVALTLIIATLCAAFASCADNEDFSGQESQFPYTNAIGGLDGLGSENLAPNGNNGSNGGNGSNNGSSDI